MAERSSNRARALILLVLLPLALRLWPIEHGMPENHVPDTHVVRNALGMARDRNPVPELREYGSTYPNLIPYVLLPVYAGQFALGRVTGEWGGAQEFGQRLLVEPERAHRTARIVLALLACFAPWAAFRAARAMGLGVGAWGAAYLVGTSLLHVQFSTQERPWALVATFLLLCAWPAALYARDGKRRHLILAGLAAAGAAATHQSGAFVLGIPGLAWLVGPRGWRGGELRARLVDGFTCVGLFGALALLVGYPHVLLHGFGADTSQIAAGDAMGENAVQFAGQALVFELRGATFVKLSRALAGYDPVLLVLGVLGLVAAVRSRAARPVTLFGLGWAAFFMTNQSDHVRYLLPVAVALAFPAAFALERAWRTPALRVAAVALLALPLVQAVRLGHVLRQADTRALAVERLAAEYADAALAIDAHGPELPLDYASLERLSGWRDLGGREGYRAQLLAAGELEGGFDAVPLEAIFDYDLRSGTSRVEEEKVAALSDDPNEALRRLGRTHVLVVDRSPDDGAPPILLDPRTGPEKMAPLAVDPEPVLTIHPGGEGGRVEDASLPVELTFPLTQLWQLERPGPLLRLYRLR